MSSHLAEIKLWSMWAVSQQQRCSLHKKRFEDTRALARPQSPAPSDDLRDVRQDKRREHNPELIPEGLGEMDHWCVNKVESHVRGGGSMICTYTRKEQTA